MGMKQTRREFKSYDSHVYWYYAWPTIKRMLPGLINVLKTLPFTAK